MATPTCDLIGRERGFLDIVLFEFFLQGCIQVSLQECVAAALSNRYAVLELSDPILCGCHRLVVCEVVIDIEDVVFL